MALRQGYKRTEVGVIPKDWRVDALGPHVDITSGESPSQFCFSTVGIPYFKVEQINNNKKYLSDTPYFVTESLKVPRGSLIFPKRGASILLNKVRILAQDSFMDTNLMTLTPRVSVHPEFLYYALTHIELWRIADITSIPQINNKHIVPLLIPFPPTLAEQEAIAEALSDADALIESLEQLLTKKQQIKAGAMQELLTGKKRLPGFSGDWKATTLGEAADIRNGATPSTQITSFWNGSIPWCTPTDITAMPGKYLLATERSITLEGLTSCAASLLPAGALLLCSRATIGEIKIAAWPLCTNQGFKSLVCKDGVSNEFLYYLLVTLKSQMIKLAKGSTFLEISKRDVSAIEVRLPSCCEQNAIAIILSDMDAEITALEAKLTKAQEIKQGMMQELLTGRIRLI